MPEITIKTRFEVGQRVTVKSKNIVGTIDLITVKYEITKAKTIASLRYGIQPDRDYHRAWFVASEDELENPSTQQ